MDQEIDIRKELEAARTRAARIPKLTGDSDEINAYWEVACGDVLAAELAIREQNWQWEIADLTREFLHYARPLEEHDNMLDLLCQAASRMAKTLYEHPRLKVELLKFYLSVAQRLENLNGDKCDKHDDPDDIAMEIDELNHNIALADNGKLDEIPATGHIKHDPVEWTARWEEIIDKADKIVYERLADHPRGMGFCHAFWHERSEVLEKEFGFAWRSPAIMNPRVMFD